MQVCLRGVTRKSQPYNIAFWLCFLNIILFVVTINETNLSVATNLF